MFCLIIFTLLIIFAKANTHQKKRLNIVIIIADDLGWNDVGFHGSNQIPTPNIDALAYNGIILNRFYTQQACTPSRTALLTGNYPIRTGLQGDPLSAGQNYSLPRQFKLLPEKLKELGYGTYLVGKWHLGYTHKSATPSRRGFDKHFGYWNAYVDYTQYETFKSNMTGFDLRENFVILREKRGTYATDLFTEKTVQYIKEHDPKKPMFLMVSHLAPHTAPNGKVQVKNETEVNKLYDYIENDERRVYAAAVNDLDKSVGEIVNALAEKNIINESLIIFLSDNGSPTIGQHANKGSNWPLRGQKMFYFEGGIRGTAVIWGSELRKNLVNNDLFHICDLMPTLYAAAGGNVTDLGKIDGINQWDMIYKQESGPRIDMLVNINEVIGISALIDRKGQYKLVNGSISYDGYYGETGREAENPPYSYENIFRSKVYEALQNNITKRAMWKTRSQIDLGKCRLDWDQPNITCNSLCLFDLFEDPCEKYDVKHKHEDIVKEMSSKILAYWPQIMPQPEKYIDPKANPIYFNNTWDTWLDENCLISNTNSFC